jgi:hypothetical protein
LACLGVAATVAVSAPALAGASTPTPPPRVVLQDFGCHRSSNSLNRWMVVTTVMRPISGTQRMAMKFDLLRKGPHNRGFTEVGSANTNDLGKWIHPTNPPTLGSRPGDYWKVHKQVVNLASPAVYRFRVSFRWLDSNGKSLGTVVRLGNQCDQY